MDERTPDQRQVIGVGMLGYGFMGRAHSNALRSIPNRYTADTPAPELVAVAGRDPVTVGAAAAQFGFAQAVTDWRELVADQRISLLDNAGPNSLHAEPIIRAAEAGMHVFCEKPLGRTSTEALQMWAAAARAHVVHMCGFNYRFVPAIALARQMIQSGEIGEVVHYRAAYLQDWLVDQSVTGLWRLDAEAAGSGALGDLGAHIIDLGRHLVGEIAAVSGAVQTFTTRRQGMPVTVDDAFASTVQFENGALGTLEASRSCPGRKNALQLEVNGTRGSLVFELERLNELRHSAGTAGFRTIIVTDPEHPFMRGWWPAGHMLGWEHTFVHEFRHLLLAISRSESVAPTGATFEDGYRAAEICDAIAHSARSSEHVSVRYRTAAAPIS